MNTQVLATLAKLEPFRHQPPSDDRAAGVDTVLTELANLLSPERDANIINRTHAGVRQFLYDGERGSIVVTIRDTLFQVIVDLN